MRGRKAGFGGGFKGFFGKGGYARNLFSGGRKGMVARARTFRGVKDIFMGGTGTFAGGTGPSSKLANVGKAGNLSKVSALTKTAKVLGPLGAVLDLGVGGFTGSSQADMSAAEQKLAGVEQNISKGEATTLGVLTGGAEKGSMFSSSLGIEKGSAGDEALGIAGAAGRGALVGGAIGSVIPVVGTAVGAAVGGVVGAVSEGFKVFTNPDSSLRKGISEFASKTGETLSGWATSAKDSIVGFAKSAGSTVSNSYSGAKSIASSAMNYVKDSTVGRAVSSVGSSISSGLSSAASAVGDFFGFAEGGIVTKPVAGLVGEAGPEAIIPLSQAQNILGGGGEVVALLKTLIAEVRKGGDVYLDGNKVGYSLALQSSQMG